jgi:uncharacterized protein YnzC (UPF0291/DUF896 family)
LVWNLHPSSFCLLPSAAWFVSISKKIVGNFPDQQYTQDMSTFTESTALDRMLEPVADLLTPEVARGIVDMRADPQLQARLDELATKANNGQLTEEERQEYGDYVDAIDFIGIFQAKARAVLARTTSV